MSISYTSNYGTFKSSKAGKNLTMQRRSARRVKYGDATAATMPSRARLSAVPTLTSNAAKAVRHAY